MIVKLFNHPHIIYQTPDSEGDLANEAIAVHVDSGGTLIVSQENRDICINRKTVPELCKLLKQLAEKAKP